MDIEDIIGRGPVNRNTHDIKIRSRKNAPKVHEDANVDSMVPGVGQKVWVRTWGCSHNTSDSEYMAGLLQNAGYNVVKDGEDALVWVLNSCTVKTPSEQQANNLVVQGQEAGKKIVMAGCVSQAAPSEPWLQNVSIVGVKQIDRIVEVVSETLQGNKVRLLSRNRPDAPLSLPKMRKNELIEVLSISTGCLNNCTYCKTKMARGDLVSYPLEELVEQARAAFHDEGVKELWLTSEDLGAWGRDIGLVLPDLLKELVKVIPDGSMMRLGMTNPPYILDHLEEIAEILNHPKVYAFLHIPVQSASDGVLNDMKREYSRRHFEKIADYMIENVPNIYIATDMILAFPTETLEDFEESMDLVRKYKFPSLFINQYYPRSGTPAARMKKIDTVEARKRTGAMSELFKSYTRFTEDRIGEIHRVLVTEIAADKIHGVGHNKCYEQILVPLKYCKMGEWIEVRVTSVTKFSMLSEPLDLNLEEVEHNLDDLVEEPEILDDEEGEEEDVDDEEEDSDIEDEEEVRRLTPEEIEAERWKIRWFYYYPMIVFLTICILAYYVDVHLYPGLVQRYVPFPLHHPSHYDHLWEDLEEQEDVFAHHH